MNLMTCLTEAKGSWSTESTSEFLGSKVVSVILMGATGVSEVMDSGFGYMGQLRDHAGWSPLQRGQVGLAVAGQGFEV